MSAVSRKLERVESSIENTKRESYDFEAECVRKMRKCMFMRKRKETIRKLVVAPRGGEVRGNASRRAIRILKKLTPFLSEFFNFSI